MSPFRETSIDDAQLLSEIQKTIIKHVERLLNPVNSIAIANEGVGWLNVIRDTVADYEALRKNPRALNGLDKELMEANMHLKNLSYTIRLELDNQNALNPYKRK